MPTPTGKLTIEMNGKDYKLWFCHLGIEALQEKFGNDFLSQVNPPQGLSVAELAGWLPPLKITNAIVRESLKRYHAADLENDPYIVGDLIAQNDGLFMQIINTAFPDAEPEGNAPKRRRKVST